MNLHTAIHTCPTCGLPYLKGMAYDEAHHQRIHQDWLNVCSWFGHAPLQGQAWDERVDQAAVLLASQHIDTQLQGAVLYVDGLYDRSLVKAFGYDWLHQHPHLKAFARMLTYDSIRFGSAGHLTPQLCALLREHYGPYLPGIPVGCVRWVPEEERY